MGRFAAIHNRHLMADIDERLNLFNASMPDIPKDIKDIYYYSICLLCGGKIKAVRRNKSYIASCEGCKLVHVGH